MPLNPDITALFERFRAAGRPAVSAGTPVQARAVMAAARGVFGAGPALARADDLSIPTRGGAIPARLLVAEGEVRGLVVYCHGGGWVIGGLDDFDAVGRVLASRSRCAVLLVDYRLAPETPFPGAVEDALDAVAFASARLTDLVGRDVPLIVAGDSAGANLVAVAAAELAGRIPIAGQVLIYPVTDRDFDTASYREHASAGILGRDDMIWFFDHYAPGIERDDARLNPLRRPDLSGLPPAHVVTAEYDVLRDEGEAYAARLREAGVPTILRRYDGLPHGFIRFHNIVPDAGVALDDVADVIATFCRR